MIERFRTFLSRFRPWQIIVFFITITALIVGAVLLYQEWDARQPMDFTLPEPVATATDVPAPEPTDIETPLPSSSAAASMTDSPSSSPEVSPSPGVHTGQPATRKPAALREDETCLLYIGKNKISVKRGIDAAILKKNVGWMETSVAPGEVGVCVLMGHRDQELKKLKDIKVGSELSLDTGSGYYTYTVYEMNIIDKDEPAQIPATTKQELMIVTCYPFFFSGSAPQQLIVKAAMA